MSLVPEDDLPSSLANFRVVPNDDLPGAPKQAPKAPGSRNIAAVLNDTVITIANAAAGGVSAVADFVSPGNRFSQFIDEEFIKMGEERQSDIVKAGREKFQQEVAQADGLGEEALAAGRYVLENPLQAAGMAVGSFAGPGVAIKGARGLASAAGLGAKGTVAAGTGAGVVTGAAMGGGDAAGEAYDLVMSTPDEILLQNDLIRAEVEKGRPLAEIKEEAATAAARKASVLPAIVGGVSGAVGVERFLAGGRGFSGGLISRATKTGLAEAIPEGFEEGLATYTGQAAAAEYDPRIDPMKGVGASATLGTVLGLGPGVVVGALDNPQSRQRQAAASQALKEAPDASSAASAANELAGSVADLVPAVDAYLSADGTIPTPEQAAASQSPTGPASTRSQLEQAQAQIEAAAQAGAGQQKLELAQTPEGRIAAAAASGSVQQDSPQARLEAAAQIGQTQQTPEAQMRAAAVDRALRNVEERGGIATPQEAQLLQESGLGQPYNQISPAPTPAAPAGSPVLTGAQAGLGFNTRETVRPEAAQQAQREAAAYQDERAAAQRAQVEQQAQQLAANEASRQVTPPAAGDVIQALVTPPATRTAEQNLAIRQAQARYTPEDFSILQRAAEAPFQLNSQERLRLRELRAEPQATIPQTQAPAQGMQATPLMGSRVAERLGLSSEGRVVTSNAKLSTARSIKPGSVQTLADGQTQHQFTVVETNRLGNAGKLLQQIGRIFGKQLVLFESDTLLADGFVLNDDNRNIYINAQSQVSPLAVFGHELLHLLKRDNPVAYQALEAVIRRNMADAQLQQFQEYYGQDGDIEELAADLMGNRFQESGFWSEVFAEIQSLNPTQSAGIISRLSAAMTRAINSFIRVVKQGGFQSDQFVDDLNSVRDAIRQAVVTYAQQQRQPAMAMEAGLTGALSVRDNDSDTNLEVPNARFSDARTNEGLPTDAVQDGRGAVEDGRNQVPEYGTAREGAVSVIGRHYSNETRQALDGRFYGRGMRGAERSRLENSTDPRLRQRVHFYVDSGSGIQPESSVGTFAHEVRLNNIYDPSTRLVPLQDDPNAFESAVLNAGFDGYITPFGNQQAVVLLGPRHSAVPVRALGQVDSAPARVPQTSAPATLRKSLLSRELNAVDASRIPGARVAMGNLEVPAEQVQAANAELERIGSDVRFSPRRPKGRAEQAGDFQIRVQKDGTVGVLGNVDEIRALLPEGVRGRPVPGGVVFTTSDAPRVRAALEGRRLAYSRAGQVLDKLPMKDGKYVGAPEKYNTPGKIATLRKNLRMLTNEGTRGRYWYENSSRAILMMAGNNVQEARKFVALLAIYSPQAKVDANSTFALRAWAQYKAGQKISVKTGVMDEKARAAMADVDAFWSGEKTGNFFFNLLREIDSSTAGKQGATIDMWMMRAGEYDTDAPTATQYAFMENETNRIAQELGWEPQQVRAAIWVAMKARMENAGVKRRTEQTSEKKGWIRFDYPLKNGKPIKTRVILNAKAHRDNWLKHAFAHTPTQADTEQAKFDFSDGVRRHIGQVSWEARPGRSTNVLPGVNDAPYEQQTEFQQAMQKALLDDNGIDLLAYKLGLLVDGPDILAPGVWQGEIAAGMQKRVAMAPAKGDAGKTEIDPAQRDALNAYAAVLGLLLRQEGVGYHRPFYSAKKSGENGVDLDVGRTLTPDEAQALWGAIDSRMNEQGVENWEDGAGMISSPTGMRVVNFGAIEDNKTFRQIIKDAAETLTVEDIKLVSFTSDGDLVGNNWKENPNGENYRSRISAAGSPDLLGWTRDVLAPRVQAVFNEFSSRYGWGDPGQVDRLFGPEASQQSSAEEVSPQRSRLSRQRQTETAAFKRWFGKSKAVVAVNAETGAPVTTSKEPKKIVPQVMYHTARNDFTEFEIGRAAINSGTFGDWETTRSAAFFTPDVQASETYGTEGGEFVQGANVMPVYIKAENPLDLTGGVDTADEQRLLDAGMSQRFINNGLGKWAMFDGEKGRDVVESIQAAGYDSVIFNDENPDTGESFESYAVFNPTQVKSAIGNNGDFDPTKAGITQSRRRNIYGQVVQSSWIAPSESKFDTFLYVMQDKNIDTRRVLEAVKAAGRAIDDRWDAYLQEELFHGRTAKQTKDFLTDELRPLLEDMQARGVAMADLEEYLHNRHAEERNIQISKVNPQMPDGGSGIDTADAQAYLSALTPEQQRNFDALAQRVDAITAGTRQVLIDAGLETQDTINAWEQAYGSYVPLMREDLDFSSSFLSMGSSRGYSVRGSASKRATGSSRPVVDILANVAMQRERAVANAQKNRVAKAIYGLAVSQPNTDFWLAVNPDAIADPIKLQTELVRLGLNPLDAKNIIEEPKQTYIDPRTGLVSQRVNPALRSSDNVMSVRVDGQDRYVFFNAKDPRSQRMVTALKNLDADQLGRVMSMTAMVTRYFASINTQYNPIFGVINFTRDVQGAALQLSTTPIAGMQKQVLADTIPALRGIYTDLRSRRRGRGAATNTWAKLWEEFQREGGQTGYRDQFSRSEERAKSLEKELKRISEGKVKQFGRAAFDWLSDYNETMENAVRLAAYKAAKDKNLSNQRAASIAKNLTVNFNRKGQVATQAGALYAFFNAAVQGTTRLAQTLAGPAGRKIMAGGLIAGSLQALILAAAGFEEDEPPDFVKERNFIIPLPDGKYLAVPMPLGYNVIPNTSRVLTEWALSGWRDSPKRVAQITGAFLEMFNPIGNAGWSVQTLAPTVVDPLVALSENRDWTGKPIAKQDRSSLDPTPGYTRAKKTASWFGEQISYYLNLASGGTDYQPGLLSPTPDQIDYLIGQATGGVGREVLKFQQTISSQLTGKELPPYKVPLLGRFYGDSKSAAAESNRFYANITRINQHENEIKGRRENREPVSDYLRENPEARLVAFANRVEREVQQLRTRRRELIDRDASPESVKMIEARITRQMQKLNDRVKTLREKVTGD